MTENVEIPELPSTRLSMRENEARLFQSSSKPSVVHANPFKCRRDAWMEMNSLAACRARIYYYAFKT